jgi:WD40 repeat protein
VLKVLTAILTGRNIIFVSSHYTLLTFVIECMFHYISPLEWRYTTITTLGTSLLDLLETPGAYLYGIHTHSLEDRRVQDVVGVVWVFLDEGRVNSDLPLDSQIPFLPADAQAKFLLSYNSLQTNPDIWMTEVPAFLSDQKQIEWRKEFEAEYDHQLTDAFLDLMVDLLGELFLFKVNGGTSIKEWSGYENCSVDDKFFYEELWKADLWLNLMQQRGTRYIRDEFTMRVDALRKQSGEPSTPQGRGRNSLFDIRTSLTRPKPTSTKKGSLSLDLTSPQSSSSSLLSIGGFYRSASELSTGGPKMVLCLPDYTPEKARYYQQVLDTIDAIISELLQKEGVLKDTRQVKILAPLYYLQGCYQATLRRPLDAIMSFDKTERYAVGVRLTKDMLTSIMKEMSSEEKECFKKMACFSDFLKILQDYRLTRQETPAEIKYQKFDKNPFSLDKFKHRLKENNVSRDIDTQLRLFNVLSQKLGTVKAEVFREFMEHWTTHKKETEAFKLPGYTLMKKQYDVPVKERVLLVKESACRSSSGSGPLVLTTYKLLVVSRGSTHEIFDMRKLVNLKLHDMHHNLLWSSPSISELVDGEEDAGQKAQKQGWHVCFPRHLVEIRNFWHSMMTELMFGYQLSIKRKSPELMEQAQTTVLITYTALLCSLFHNEDEAKKKRTISKLQNFAKKDESIQTQQLPGLKCRLNPSLEEADKRTIECSLYVPPGEDGEGQGKLWLGLGSGLLKVYDLETRSPEAYVKVTDCYHRKGARLSCLLLVGDYVWAGSLNKTIHILNSETCCVESRLSHLVDDVRDLALDAENNVVWSLLLIQNKVIAWDPVQKEPIRTIDVPDCQQCKCLTVYRNQLWIGTNNGISVFDKEKGCLLKRIASEGSPLDVRCLSVSSTNDVWCSSPGSEPLIVYDPNTFKCKHSVSDLKFRVNVILTVEDMVWCGTNRGKIVVYCAKTFKQKSLMDAHGDTIRTMVTAARGFVISGCASRDGTAAIWDASKAIGI